MKVPDVVSSGAATEFSDSDALPSSGMTVSTELTSNENKDDKFHISIVFRFIKIKIENRNCLISK